MAGLGTLSSRSSLSLLIRGECATSQSPLIPDLNSLVGYSSTIKCYKFGFLACVYPDGWGNGTRPSKKDGWGNGIVGETPYLRECGT